MVPIQRSRLWSKRRTRPRLTSLTFCSLEKRDLLATLEPVVVADYQDDFRGGGDLVEGWAYQWNAPTGWVANGPTGNLKSGSIEDASSFRPLQAVGNSRIYTPDGDLRFGKNPDRFLSLYGIGGHPGSVAAGVQRYAIATYTVSESGYYTIEDSSLNLIPRRANLASSFDGVSYRVFVNQGNVIDEGIAESAKISYFDSELGYLVPGDQVHVAIGANQNHGVDSFRLDYSIVQQPQRELVVANFQDDFREGTPAKNWRYLWNAPQGWKSQIGGGGSRGALQSGAIGDVASYRSLVPAGDAWTADGNLLADSAPDSYLRLTRDGGQPGNVLGQARHVIAAYSVPNSGLYGIQDSWLTTNQSLDGVTVRVHVDGGGFVNEHPLVAVASETISFDTSLGYLQKGDTIYVAFGANENHIFDDFATDYSIVRLAPRAAPDLSLLHEPATVIEVQATNGNGFWPIQNAIDQARRTPGNVEIRLSPGIYRLQTPIKDTSLDGRDRPSIYNDQPFFMISETDQDLIVNGQGSTLITDDFTRGIFSIFGQNIIVKDLTVDYATAVNSRVPSRATVYRPAAFTQGIISNVDSVSRSFVLTIDTSEFLPATAGFTQASVGGQGGQFWGYAVDPDVTGRSKDGARSIYGTQTISGTGRANQYLINAGSVAGLANGDRYVLQRRNGNAMFGVFEASNVSLINVTAYSGPSTFLSSLSSESVNLIDSDVVIRPGSNRWSSINADAVHAQANRVGVWVDNSHFEGIGDDVMNFYGLPSTALRRVSTPGVADNTTFELAQFARFGLVATFESTYRVGDELTFVDPSSGLVIAKARVAKVEQGLGYQGNATIRVTLDQPVDNVRLGTDNPQLNNSAGYRDDTLVFNSSSTQGYVVQDSVLTSSRRYGNFVMAENVDLVDNTYTSLPDQAIAGHTELSWPLGSTIGNVLVQGNKFRDIGFGADYLDSNYAHGVIAFFADRQEHELVYQPEYSIQNIRILDNTIDQWSKRAIVVRNVQRALIANNSVGRLSTVSTTGNVVLQVQFTNEVVIRDNQMASVAHLPNLNNNVSLSYQPFVPQTPLANRSSTFGSTFDDMDELTRLDSHFSTIDQEV